VIVFTAASALAGFATSSEFLIFARALQGLGAAMVSPAALSIVTTTFKDGPERAKALSVWAAIAVGGAAVGLLLGGVLTEYLSWEWIFFVNLPVGVAAALLSLRYIPESKVATRGVDVLGAVSVTAGLTLLVFAIVRTQDYGWLAIETVGLAVAAAALLAAFVLIERRSPAPLVRLSIFRTRSLTGANVAMLAVAGGMFAVFFFASLYVQGILGFTPVEAGLAFLPLTAGIIVFSGVAQPLVARVGVNWVAMAGMTIAAAGLMLLSLAPVDGTYVADVLPGLLVMSAGLGLTFVPLTLIATTNVADEDAGLASGLFNSSQQIGGALGLAILSTVAASTTTDALPAGAASSAQQASALVDGYQMAFAVGAGLMIVGVIVTALFIRRRDVAAIQTGEAPAMTGV
jgi:EmrB/QacA subfamily drug resistance transporter